ncbi:3-keto-disaccharide hydrolase [Seonamhaeicola aphaedonensis]|uniref:Uncharacterized protein DUF1080 n=1 Tax=Seonamhaeicola aphaedonensis TaxID=1461338 RepID=A0A3D9HEA6_9FLAO|nr:DUF1080 domain-containing protein [Seonamhaeicola aphaedonensis]RED47804.1 uncharacterized protein DUF1080 [Seonamhaeicola aphaedonensis]
MRTKQQIFILCSAILIGLSTLAQNNQKNKKQLLNTDKEPKLKSKKFKSLFDGETLNGWSPKQGTMKFEVVNGDIVGTCSAGPSTFLCTDKTYTDFIFTCEMKWEVDGNSGVQIRSRIRKDPDRNTVIGPQAEMEDLAKKGRGWSGGIYGQNCGGWFYPLKAPEHRLLKNAIDRSGWNRLTIKVVGNVFKTWVNGIPAAHWIDEENEYPTGFIGLQVHGGKQGIIHWRNLKIREL